MKKVKTAVKIAKIVGGVIISVGIGAITVNLIKATTPENVKKITKFCIHVGGFFAASLAAAAAKDNLDGTVDSVMTLITKFMEMKDGTEEKIVIEGETI